MEDMTVKNGSSWMKAGLIIVLIALNKLLVMSLTMENFDSYRLWMNGLFVALYILIGMSFGWLVKAKPEDAGVYAALSGIFLLMLVFPAMYYLLPGMPYLFYECYDIHELASIAFGLFAVLLLKAKIDKKAV
jgi:hypothetical protein